MKKKSVECKENIASSIFYSVENIRTCLWFSKSVCVCRVYDSVCKVIELNCFFFSLFGPNARDQKYYINNIDYCFFFFEDEAWSSATNCISRQYTVRNKNMNDYYLSAHNGYSCVPNKMKKNVLKWDDTIRVVKTKKKKKEKRKTKQYIQTSIKPSRKPGNPNFRTTHTLSQRN